VANEGNVKPGLRTKLVMNSKWISTFSRELAFVANHLDVRWNKGFGLIQLIQTPSGPTFLNVENGSFESKTPQKKCEVK